jgi:hypothetical protein
MFWLITATFRGQSVDQCLISSSLAPEVGAPVKYSLRRWVKAVDEIAGHVIVTSALLAGFWVVDHVYNFLWGKDALLFNFVPFKWVIQAADISIVAFVYVGVRSLLRAYRDE